MGDMRILYDHRQSIAISSYYIPCPCCVYDSDSDGLLLFLLQEE